MQQQPQLLGGQTEYRLGVPRHPGPSVVSGHEFQYQLAPSIDGYAIVAGAFELRHGGSDGEGGIGSEDRVLGEAAAGHHAEGTRLSGGGIVGGDGDG